ncbi:amidohydrolase family protein [Pacificimonas sp. ICDLI1SI03]
MPNAAVKLFDTHAHFFTSDTDAFPVDVTGAREGEDAIRQRISKDPIDAERLLNLWDETGVTGGAAVQYNTIYKTDNRYALAVADQHPDRASTVLILNAAAPDTPAIIRELAKAHNVAGLRLFGYPDERGEYPWLDSSAALKSWEMAASLGLSMVVMYAPGRPSAAALQRIKGLARRFPSTPIAIDHCGWPAVDSGDEGTVGAEHAALADAANIHFKFTQINLNRFQENGIDPARFVQEMVHVFGARRLMWGSDVGNTTVTYGDMVAQAIAATSLLSEEERVQVLHDNGQRLFGRGVAI